MVVQGNIFDREERAGAVALQENLAEPVVG
jgi:hypothetical protein